MSHQLHHSKPGSAPQDGWVTESDGPSGAPAPAVNVQQVTRTFGQNVALDRVSLELRSGEVHVLLGPGGAGKTTLIRILARLSPPTSGAVRSHLHACPGFVPAGDGSFYRGLSGRENLVFFARLHGYRRREAVALAGAVLAQVGLDEAAGRPVHRWSNSMQKRLSIARALITRPDVLLVDEATRDLDPEGAQSIRLLVSLLAARGTAVLWATQRVEEVRGFADSVTFLAAGSVRFSGSVAVLNTRRRSERYVLRLRSTVPVGPVGRASLQHSLGGIAMVTMPRADDPEHVILEPRAGHAVGDVIAVLAQEGFAVLSCRGELSELEEAFFALADEGSR
jgi:ABC-type multidrug transport system ATPase subunit